MHADVPSKSKKSSLDRIALFGQRLGRLSILFAALLLQELGADDDSGQPAANVVSASMGTGQGEDIPFYAGEATHLPLTRGWIASTLLGEPGTGLPFRLRSRADASWRQRVNLGYARSEKWRLEADFLASRDSGSIAYGMTSRLSVLGIGVAQRTYSTDRREIGLRVSRVFRPIERLTVSPGLRLAEKTEHNLVLERTGFATFPALLGFGSETRDNRFAGWNPGLEFGFSLLPWLAIGARYDVSLLSGPADARELNVGSAFNSNLVDITILNANVRQIERTYSFFTVLRPGPARIKLTHQRGLRVFSYRQAVELEIRDQPLTASGAFQRTLWNSTAYFARDTKMPVSLTFLEVGFEQNL